jgi:gliding motility-associated-like protein
MTQPIRLFFFLYVALGGQWAYAQPALNWDVTFGGYNYEELNGLVVAPDGLFVAGSSRSNADFGNPADTSWNILLTKLDLAGNPLWHRMLGGDRNDRLWQLVQTADGGLLLGGYSFSGISGQKTSAAKGGMDAWLLRLDADGNLLWDRSYGGADRDELFDILPLPDGTFLLGCHSSSGIGGDKSEACRGDLDFWLVCVDNQGVVLWEKTIGGNAEDQIHDLALLPDGSVLASGGTISQRNTGEVGPDFARGAKDYWIVNLDLDSRQIRWNHRFGGSDDDFAYDLLVSQQGHILLGGRSASPVAPPTAYNNGKEATFYGGESDYWLLQLDFEGKKMREWSFGGSGLDDLYALHENEWGQLVLGGVSDSPASGNKTAPLRGQYDFWVIGLDADRTQKWQKTIGGTDIDALTKMARMTNGALVVGGHSQSDAGFEKTNNSLGVNDFWVVSMLCELTVDIRVEATPGICSSEPLLLTAVTNECVECQYRWSNEATTSSIELPPGTRDTLIVRVADVFGCVAADTVVVVVPNPPVLDLGGADTLRQNDQTLSLGTTWQPNWTYAWSTGEATATIQVTTDGTYALTVTDSDGCTAADAIRVLTPEVRAVFVPNVFSPNLDGVNDFLTVYANESVVQVQVLHIADRWGEPVFLKKNFSPNVETEGWDGRYKGKRLPPDLFVWYAVVEYTDGSTELFKGDVSIVR